VAVLTLGLQEGIENNLVAVNMGEASFPATTNGSGLPAMAGVTFVASGRVAGDPANTSISSVVLDNSNQPVPGVTFRLKGTSLATTSDAEGQFRITGVPVEPIRLLADGSTATRPGTWPTLEFDLVPVPGIDNVLPMPIYLLPLDVNQGVLVTETEGATLTLNEISGFELEIEPGSVTFPDGSKSGFVSVTVVHADKIPMVPNFGQQPKLIVTIQPAGARFDPPAKMALPNLDGLVPGEITEMYSFDHDAGRFVSIGPGIVSPDGSVITSAPGFGIIKGGWHCGGNPAPTGCCAKPCKGGGKCQAVSGDTCTGCTTTKLCPTESCGPPPDECTTVTGAKDVCGCAGTQCKTEKKPCPTQQVVPPGSPSCAQSDRCGCPIVEICNAHADFCSGSVSVCSAQGKCVSETISPPCDDGNFCTKDLCNSGENTCTYVVDTTRRPTGESCRAEFLTCVRDARSNFDGCFAHGVTFCQAVAPKLQPACRLEHVIECSLELVVRQAACNVPHVVCESLCRIF